MAKIKLTESKLRKIVNESVRSVLSEISWGMKKRAYDASMVDGEYGKERTSRSDSIRNQSMTTVFENASYKIDQDVNAILLYFKESGDVKSRDHKSEGRWVYNLEMDGWTQPAWGAIPKESPNDKQWVEAVNALCKTIASTRKEYNLQPSKYTNSQIYFDSNIDKQRQNKRDMEDFMGVSPSFDKDDWRVTSTKQQEIFSNEVGSVKQAWPRLILTVSNQMGGTNYYYDYNNDSWTGHSGQEINGPTFGQFNGNTKQLANAVVGQIAKFRQLKGLEPSKWQNVNIYFKQN